MGDCAWVAGVGRAGAGALLRLWLCAMLGAAAMPLQAQEWPARPVRIIFPYAAGAGDTIIRLVAERLGRRLGQTFLVENQPGASGIIGSTTVSKAPPDGYALIVSSIGTFIVAPFFNTAPWDPLKNFTHIALLGGPPAALVVGAASEARNVKDLVAMSKAIQRGIGYGTPGRGTHAHLIGEMFRKASGATLFDVPYNGGVAALSDLIGGHLPAAFVSLGAAASLARAGKARLLGISTTRRSPEFPDAPTFAESGFTDLVATTWFGLSGPAGLPRGIVDRLNADVRAVLGQPEMRDRLQAEGVESQDLDADGFTAFIRAEFERWAPIAKSVK